ncbi:MAG: hypothetical protein M1470_09010 [Bacteroidetes bacterium]|nr:hypothetical protein [Bacteroidota bacterium]MCL5737305.1 hypothetical protein [Bacteroidota bacterium]
MLVEFNQPSGFFLFIELENFLTSLLKRCACSKHKKGGHKSVFTRQLRFSYFSRTIFLTKLCASVFMVQK